MAWVDMIVVAVYFLSVVAIGVWSGREEKTTEDYFLGSRRQPWLIVGLSILATELSAITFVGVPGRAFATNCDYIQLYFGSFLGRMVVVLWVLPAFYRSRVTTVYEYLGRRFGKWTRGTAAVLFFVSRIIGSGLRLLAASIAVSVILGWDLQFVIVGTAIFAVGYTMFGGIKAIIWTDALQAIVFLSGAFAALIYMVVVTPGSVMDQVQLASEAGKLHVFDWGTDWNTDKVFWVLVIHAAFLNAAVFGTDQDLTQRMLTCSDARDGQRSLLFNALAGFPVIVLFLAVGVGMYGYYAAFPEMAPVDGTARDRLFPHFISNALPSGWGIKGLLVCGVFAAAMSSLDSALGALSSTAVVDFYQPYIARARSATHYLRAGRIFSACFGVLLVVTAMGFSGRSDLLQEAFDWASLIFGSMLGVFLLGVLTTRRGSDVANVVAMLTGVGILAGMKFRQDATDEVLLAWPWWIVFGTLWTFGIGALFRGAGRSSLSKRCADVSAV